MSISLSWRIFISLPLQEISHDTFYLLRQIALRLYSAEYDMPPMIT